MSEHSHTAFRHSAFSHTAGHAVHHETTAPEFPRHVVTAVLVTHDGERWLPEALAGLQGQERPVQNVVAADTGSADGSAGLVTEAFGADRVLHMARRSGFGTAVDEAVRTAPALTPEDLPYLKRPSGWDPVSRTWRDEAYDMPELPHGEPVQWLWLLHDDCAPEPDALAQLLRVVDADPSVAVAGPKLRSWYDRRQLLEAGVSIANSGRRWTGVERREQDQGQHDQVRPVLSVSSAGMLIRRDVYEQLGGFDRRLPLMRDDVDLCWRAQSAGHRVLVVPDAAMRHAEAASRERRPVDCVGRLGRAGAGPHRVDKAGAVYTLLANAPAAKAPWVLLRLILGTLLRTLAYLVGKVPGQALDEVAGLSSTLLRPGRLLGARRRRGRPAVAHGDLRPLFPPPGATVRVTVEQVASNFGGRSEPELSGGGRHGAVETGPGGDDADFLEVEQFARLKRIARKPGPVLFAVLLLVSLVACRGLIGGGALAGGALLPAPEDVGDIWARYTGGWHPVGTGGTEAAPPYLALVALIATLLFGSTGLALTLLLVCSVPLAGLTAYFASRPLTGSRLLRAWGSIAYAFLPAATGALAGGRIGTALLAILLPVTARVALTVGGLRARPTWRSAWTLALLLTLTTAFTPVVWPVTLVLGCAALVLEGRRDDGSPRGAVLRSAVLRVVVVLLTPVVLLAPWSLSLFTRPVRFLGEAGLPYGGGAASALDLLTLTPGGPGTTGSLLLGGVVLAALAALLRRERQPAIRTAWVVALAGLLFAALSNSSAWAGPATLVYGAGLLCAAVTGAEGAKERVAAQSFGWRQPVAALIAAAAVAAPLFAAVGWMVGGADGPLSRRDPVQVPAFVAEESKTEDQSRTLVLSGDSADGATGATGGVSYALVRGSGARLGDGDLAAAGGDDAGLRKVVANLVAGSGADQSAQLSDYAVGHVLVRDGAPRQMSRTLDRTPGLARFSQKGGDELWGVDRQVSRVTVVPGDGADSGPGGGRGADGTEPVPVAAGPVEAHTDIDSGPAGRVLRLADSADGGWRATLDGKPLDPVTVDGWAQGFRLPASGGRLDLTHEAGTGHVVRLCTQALLAVVVVVLALPGQRRETDDDLPETAATVPAQPVAGEGRRARRLRAAADTEGMMPAAASDGAAAPRTDAGGAGTEAAPVPQAPPPSEPPLPGAPPTPEGQPGEWQPGAGQQDAWRQDSWPQHSWPQGEPQYGQPQYGQQGAGQPQYGWGEEAGSQAYVPQQPYGDPYSDPYSAVPGGGPYGDPYGAAPYGDPYGTAQSGAHGVPDGQQAYTGWDAQYDPYAATGDPYGYDGSGTTYGDRSDQQ